MPIRIAAESVETVADILESYSHIEKQCKVDFKDVNSITVYGQVETDEEPELDEDGDYIEPEPSVAFTVTDLDDTDRKVLREALYKIAARKLAQQRNLLLKLGIEIENTPNHPMN